MTHITDTYPLQDRIILVTGAGDGLGRAAALHYAKAGATIILLGKTIGKLEQVYDEIEAANGPTPAIYPMNLESANENDYATLADTIEKEFNILHGILHCAATLGALTPLEHYPADLWYKVLQVNLNAAFLLTRTHIPLLKRSANSAVLFSIDQKSRAYWGAYGVSKAGLLALVHILADELDNPEQRIRVNAIDPGPTRTQLRSQAYPGDTPDKLTSPEEKMQAYLDLIRPNSTGVNGQLITL